MQVFTLAVLPVHPAQMPILTTNVNMQGGEDRPRQNGPQFLPFPKRQGGQVRFIARPYSCRSPCGAHLGHDFLNSAAAAIVSSGAAAAR